MNALATAGGVTISAPAAIIFTILVLITLGVTYWASQRNKSVESHLVAKGAVSGRANGVAIAGDFISAATVLGTTGAIALTGPAGSPILLPIPMDNQLLGVTLNVQGVALDATSFALANALDITLGSR